jgi:hypothetical protein
MTSICAARAHPSWMKRLLWAAGVGFVVVGGMAYAGAVRAQLAQPDCEAIAAWAAGFDRNDEWQPNALGKRHRFAGIFAGDQTTALFGAPMVLWTEPEVMRVREMILSCRQATKDRELSATYNAMQSALVSRVANFSKAAAGARENVNAAMDTLQRQPPGLPLLSFYSALSKASTVEGYAQVQRTASGVPAAAAGAARVLVTAVADLPEAEIESSVAVPAEQRALAMRSEVVDALLAEVRQVPASVQGLGQLERMAQVLPRDYAAALGAAATEAVLRALADRRGAVADEIATGLVAQIGQSSQGFDAFLQIDELSHASLLQPLPAPQADRVRAAAQARREAVSGMLHREMMSTLAALPANDASLQSVDMVLHAIAGWPASADPFKTRFEADARKRRADLLGVINKAEAGTMRGRVYESADKTHKFEFVDRTRVFIHASGHTAAGAYTEENDGRITVTVNGQSSVLTREGRRLLGWRAPVIRTK